MLCEVAALPFEVHANCRAFSIDFENEVCDPTYKIHGCCLPIFTSWKILSYRVQQIKS